MLHETNEISDTTFLNPDTLPKIGFIATEGAIPVCIGFLRMLEGGYAQIDTLVTNRDLTSHIRHEGISIVVNELLNKAKSLNLKGIISFTTSKDIIDRAQTLGFKQSNQQVIVLDLGHSS